MSSEASNIFIDEACCRRVSLATSETLSSEFQDLCSAETILRIFSTHSFEVISLESSESVPSESCLQSLQHFVQQNLVFRNSSELDILKICLQNLQNHVLQNHVIRIFRAVTLEAHYIRKPFWPFL